MYPYICIFGHCIGTYGICMLLGFGVVFLFAMRKGKPMGLILEDLLIVSAFVLGCALVFGNFLYAIVTYTPEQIGTYIRAGDLSFLGSGIVFYGGLLGGLLGALIGIRVAGCNLITIERSVVPFIPLGHAIGRVGCVMAGCCHGFAYDGPLALYYPNSVIGLPSQQGYFPVQLLESLINIGICIFLLWYEKKAKRVTDILFVYLGFYAFFRFFIEMLRGDTARGIWNTLSTSQIISIILLVICIVVIMCKSKSVSHNN